MCLNHHFHGGSYYIPAGEYIVHPLPLDDTITRRYGAEFHRRPAGREDAALDMGSQIPEMTVTRVRLCP